MTQDGCENEDAEQIAQARGAIYNLLARCFYAPTRELLDDVTRGPSAPLLRKLLGTFQLGTLEEMFAPGGNGVGDENNSDSQLLRSLKEEYVRLFEGPGHMQVAPYESVHRKDVPEIERGLVMGPSTVDARRRYAEAGLAIAKDFTDLPDHIAVELEFMYYLCAREAEAGGRGNDGEFMSAQKEFLRDHLLKWIPEFGTAVVNTSNVRFYRDLARLTLAYVASEATDLLETGATD